MSTRLLIVSNRLPVVFETVEGRTVLHPGAGGLVTALAPVLGNRGGLWIGWTGVPKDDIKNITRLLASEGRQSGYELKGVQLDRSEIEQFYHGFSNEIIWPLFHDLQSRCNFDPSYWNQYVSVNGRYASVISRCHDADDFIWVHDYHLMLVGQKLRDLAVHSSIGFFLHIPFPPLDIFVKLPWRFQILQALLQYDLLGFQTVRDRRNFISCVRTLLPDASMYAEGTRSLFRLHNRTVRAGCFPIGIDYKEHSTLAAQPDVTQASQSFRTDHPVDKVLIGVDRLDYTKGIPFRLEAFRYLLRSHPELQGKVTLVQVVVPSRAGIPEYLELKSHIERLVGEINGEFTQSGWTPIQYMYRNLKRTELLAYYRASDIAFITPLKDGMNLVAKEYCASKINENGVLILSEFAGAAAQLQKYALLVNPYDIVGVAEMLYRACNMPLDEQRYRMRRLRSIVKRQDIFWWVDSFLDGAVAKDLVDFPLIADFTPLEFGNSEVSF